ncbi:MAG: ABC transporter permease [Phycisphaerales bacterium]|nr:ABC transporter permease [Phycisphaerales bacterium]
MLKILTLPIVFVIRLLWQTVFLAISQVWANKFRSVLTALGIIIGVFGVTVVTAGLDGMQGFVLNKFEQTGAKKMWVWGDIPEDKETVLSWNDVKPSIYEANLILEHAETVEALTPRCRASWNVSYGKKLARNVSVTGIWPSWHEIENRQVLFGRPFSQIDDDENRQVCLINETGIEELGLDIDPVDQYILVNKRRFLIVGVLETKEAGIMGNGQSRTEIYIPFATHKMMNPYTGTVFALQVVDPEKSEDTKAEIRFILRNHRNLGPEDKDTFDMFVLQSIIEDFNKIARVISFIMYGVIGISLLVGGIGIMNIMLVSVSERTREIGLRKAMGAKPPVVLLQFLVEAIVLCVIGGLVGLLFGNIVVMAIQFIPDFPLESISIPKWAVILSLGFSAGVGIIFGMFPAIKASMLNPIDALRHE